MQKQHPEAFTAGAFRQAEKTSQCTKTSKRPFGDHPTRCPEPPYAETKAAANGTEPSAHGLASVGFHGGGPSNTFIPQTAGTQGIPMNQKRSKLQLW
jgi:hypothetical protein